MQTKYPIVLVHGVAIKNIKFFKCFGQIDRILKIQGYHVYISNHDAFGSIATNAKQIKDFILDVMKKEGTDKVNIIAHSKGGLDSKYMIQELGMEDNVASLTTLSTPHKGSPLATKLVDMPKWIVAILNFWINLIYKIFGDKHPNALQAGKDLARVEKVDYVTLGFSKKVYCQSFSSMVKEKKYTFVDGIPLFFSRYFEKKVETDGMVPVDSAIFGEYKGNISDDISHSQIIDFCVGKRKKKDKIYTFYSSLCEDLVKMGF